MAKTRRIYNTSKDGVDFYRSINSEHFKRIFRALNPTKRLDEVESLEGFEKLATNDIFIANVGTPKLGRWYFQKKEVHFKQNGRKWEFTYAQAEAPVESSRQFMRPEWTHLRF